MPNVCPGLEALGARLTGGGWSSSCRYIFGAEAAGSVICEDTLKKISDLGQLRAFNMNGRRAYRLEDLDAYVESLPGWYDSTGEKSAKVVGDRRVS